MFKNVGERSNAGQKFNRKIGIRETNYKRAEPKGTFCPGSGILHEGPEGVREKKKGKKEREKEKFAPGSAFLVCRPESAR